MADTAIEALRELLESIQARLETLEQNAGIQAPVRSAPQGEVPRVVRAFDQHIQAHVAPFVEACKELGADCVPLGEVVERAWNAQRDVILVSTKSKKPNDNDMRIVVRGLNECVEQSQGLVQRGDWERHQKAVSGGLGCLSWIVIAPAPTDFIENFIGESDFYANKIRVEFKTKDPKQIAFCDTFKELIKGLMSHVKEHHTTGLEWNPRGEDFSASMLQGGAGAAEEKEEKQQERQPAQTRPVAQAKQPSGGASDIFAELNKGGGITAGLKKVSRDQQTWRAEYKGEKEPAKQSAPKPTPRRVEPQTKGPPVCEFQARGNKWVVENQTADQGVVEVTADNVKHMVYVYGCYGATINITGKFKSLVIDSCQRTKVLFDAAISSCELVNCKRMQIQIRATVPSVAIDKTDGCLVYLSAESLGTQFVTSKSSEMNVAFPNDAGDMLEMPIPEQFFHNLVFQGDKATITSQVSDLYA